MTQYSNFNEVLRQWVSLPVPGRLYVEGAKKDAIRESSFWVVSSKETKDGDYFDEVYGSIPEVLKGLGAKSLLDTATFQDVIQVKLDNSPNLDVEKDEAIFLHALIHYLEFDDFED